ncbi:MAG: hypothetical protein IJT87_12255 [Ruminiclostridium sp.]|nr:hypothetical protein [Ruminiclostridium sp.]
MKLKKQLKKIFKTDIGKILAVIAGIGLLLLIIKAATPNTVNICVNNGNDCVLSFKKAKKTKKPKKKN